MISVAEECLKFENRKTITDIYKSQSILDWAFVSEIKLIKIPAKKHGAIIICPNRELILQNYIMLRKLCPDLSIYRTTGMTDIVGSIKLFSDPKIDVQSIKAKGLENLSLSLDWNYCDIVITGARGLQAMINFQRALNLYTIYPTTIVFEEADILLKDRYYRDPIKQILQHFSSQSIQYISTLSSLNGNVQNFRRLFKETSLRQSDDYERLPKNVKFDYIHLENNAMEIDHLLHLIKTTRSKTILVYASSNNRAADIKKTFDENDIKVSILNTAVGGEQRSTEYFKFTRGETRILLASELVTRGLNLNIDHVVIFERVNTTSSLLQRIGMTGRTEKISKVTIFIRPGDEWMVDKLKPDALLRFGHIPGRKIEKTRFDYTTSDYSTDGDSQESNKPKD